MANTIKAEMWDRMQFLFRNYYDRMVHIKLVYKGEFDIVALKSAIVYMVENVPVLHSSFTPSQVSPVWTKQDYTVDDILTVYDTTTPDIDADSWLLKVIPYDNNVQINIAIFKDGENSIFAMRVNHMCMDGGDAKQFLDALVKNYNAIKKGEYKNLYVKGGSRAFEQVYSKFEGRDLKHAKGLYKNTSKIKDKVPFPWSEQREDDTNQIVKRKIDADKFDTMRGIAKSLGITVNDALMAIVFRALYEMCDLDDNAPITVSCAIDLRKHIVEGGKRGGFTNHTSWMALRTTSKGESMRDTIVNVIRATKGYKRDKFLGLYSLPLLKLAYTIFPPSLAEFAIKLGYDNPLIAVSNVGVIDDKALAFDGLTLFDGFMSGAVKYKPFFLMTVTTMLGTATLSTAIRGNEKDIAIANKYFDLVEKYLDEFNSIDK